MFDLFERNRPLRIAALLTLAALTVFVYFAGLHGPFLIDDIPNLEPLQRWVDGRLDWRSVLDNRSGPLGRSVSMLTFLADTARVGQMDSTAFKTTNLAIHILCGLLVYIFCLQLLRRAAPARAIAHAAAMFIAAWWLLLPLHVSTVLYIIQRMAQLGALFTLASLIAYIAIRQRMNRRPSALLPQLALWSVFPLIVGIGALAKENAILAVPEALLVELIFFAQRDGTPPPRSVVAFFITTVALPGAIAAIWILLHPNIILAGYLARPFTLSERLLTEPRVLWSYVKTMLFPVGKDMGLFHDNYPISTGWLSPWTTLAASVGWLLAILVAVLGRRRYPLVSFGIGFFLIGHLLESTLFSLEIYFEHRNYLPDLGILIAIAGAAHALWMLHPHHTREFRRIVLSVPALVLAIFAIATWVQAGSWSNVDTLLAMQESYNPTSPRLQAILGAREVERGNTDAALAHVELAERFSPASERIGFTLWRFIAYCSTGQRVPDAVYAEFEQRANLPITLNAMRYWEEMAQFTEKGCLDAKRLAVIGRRWIEDYKDSPQSQLLWRSWYNLARIDAVAGDIPQAEADARRAWNDSDRNTGIGVLLFQLNATLGRRKECEIILGDLRRQMNTGNADLVDAVNLFTKALDDGKIGDPAKHP